MNLYMNHSEHLHEVQSSGKQSSGLFNTEIFMGLSYASELFCLNAFLRQPMSMC